VKIVDVETFVVANPPPSFGGRYFTFVKLVTDDGIIGYGEAYAGSFHPEVVAAMLADVAERHLVGHDPAISRGSGGALTGEGSACALILLWWPR
jgi:galactonate dehydratase